MSKGKLRTIETTFVRGTDLEFCGRILNGISIGYISKDASPREKVYAWGIQDSKVAELLAGKFKEIAKILKAEGK